jgi:hypothetical protein
MGRRVAVVLGHSKRRFKTTASNFWTEKYPGYRRVRCSLQRGIEWRGKETRKGVGGEAEKVAYWVNVWDGESLLCLGTANVDLKPLLRISGQRNTQVTAEFDVVYKDM